MWELFWVEQPILDAIYLTNLALFVLLTIVVSSVPDLVKVGFATVVSGKEDELYLFVGRHMPWRQFAFYTFLQQSIGCALLVWLFLRRSELIPSGLSLQELYIPAALFGGFLLLLLVRSLLSRIWKWLFIPQVRVTTWRCRELFLAWLWSATLPFLSIALILPTPPLAVAGVVLVFFLLWRIVFIAKMIRSLREVELSSSRVFLYLCAHEILPLVYLLIAVVAETMNSQVQEFLWQRA